MNQERKESSKDKSNKGKQPAPKKPKFNIYWVYGLLAILFIAMQFMNFGGGDPEEISWEKFHTDILLNNEVEKIIVVNGEFAEVFIKEDFLKKDKHESVREGHRGRPHEGPHYIFSIGSIDVLEQRMQRTYEQQEHVERIPVQFETRKDWASDILSWLLPIGLLIAFWIFIMRRMAGGGGGGGGQIFNIGKSKAQLFDKDIHVSVNFKDVAGLEEAKVEIMEIVDFLKNPSKYTKLGGKIPKGVLLVGPPGTGKTLLARAVAGEAQVPFFSMSGSDFVEMFVGVGASRVRDLFKQAKSKAPCIIFIDEIDAVGRARGKANFSGANDERENTLNQLLTEMDGFASNQGVIILAATNRADVLDKALLRAGRFDRQIHVEMPDLKERQEIFGVHTKSLKVDNQSVSEEFLARQTPGFSGADIANVCNEAALIASRRNKEKIEKQDFLDAIDRIIGGLEKKNKIISKAEKNIIAYHEAGHAAVSWLLKHAHPLIKVTIVPRGKALGAAWYLPEERQITTYEQMFEEITATLGGRASEEIMFGEISTGALNDLEKVTKQAHAMVTYYGLNKTIGNLSYYDSTGQNEYSFTKPYSEKTAQVIDEEISKIVEKAYTKARNILIENKKELEALAQRLLEKEVIFKEDVEEIFGKRPFDEEAESAKENETPKMADNNKSTDNSPKASEESDKNNAKADSKSTGSEAPDKGFNENHKPEKQSNNTDTTQDSQKEL